MTRLLDALDRLDSLRPKPSSTQAQDQSPVSSQPRQTRTPRESRGTRPRVPRSPTHLDLTDDTPEEASDFSAIDLEPAVPQATRNRIKPGRADRRVVTTQTPPAQAESRTTVRPAPDTETFQKADPRLPQAQDDVFKLALQIRASLHRAHTHSLMVCGVESGQSVRAFVRELALAFVQLGEAPLLIVDLEPSTPTEARSEFYPLEETDSAIWLDPGPRGKPSAAVLCPSKLQQARRGGFVSAEQFSRNLDTWQTDATLMICCARSVSDSSATLVAGSCCGGTVLVVPGTGSSIDSVVAARELCTRLGMTVLGCVIDHTPADPSVADQ